MLELKDGTKLDPDASQSESAAYFTADGRVLVTRRRGAPELLGPAPAESPEASVERVLREAAPENAAVLPNWLVHLLQKLTELAIDTAAYAGPWEYGYFGPVPRRKLSPHANFLVGEGMYESWKDWYVAQGILPHLELARHAISRELAEPLDLLPRQLVRYLLLRDGADSSEASAVLAEDRVTFPASLTARYTELSRTPEWLVHRLLNGMFPSYLRRVPGAPDDFDVVFEWNAADLKTDGSYWLPDARARLRREGDHVALVELSFRYPGDAEPISVPMQAEAAPAWLRERAGRAFRSVYLLAAEIDRHIVLGHLLTEFVLVGVHHNLSPDNPLYRLLVPFLQYVDVANHIGDQLVWGEHGVLVLGSAFSATGLKRRFAERLGAFDWKGFAPHQRALVSAHYAPRVQAEFWACVNDYVETAFAELAVPSLFPHPTSNPHGAELVALAAELEQASVPHTAYDGLTADSLFEASELAFERNGKSFSRIETLSDLKQFCAFTIYIATLGHGWANVRQYEEGGELEYASFGLRERIDAAPPSDPGDDSEWHQRSAPLACDQANQLLQGYVLSNLPVATLVGEAEGPRPGDDLLPDVLGSARGLGARLARLGTKFRELRAQSPFGALDEYCDAAMIPARPNA